LETDIKLKKQEVLDWFGGKAEYLKFHSDIHGAILFDEL